MPIEREASRRAIARNIETEERAGRPKKQAVVIALHTADESEKSVPDVNDPVAAAEMHENFAAAEQAERIPYNAQHAGDVHGALGQVKDMMNSEEPAIDHPQVKACMKRVRGYLTKSINHVADTFAKAYPDLEPLERHDEEEVEEGGEKERKEPSEEEDEDREPTAEEKALLARQVKALRDLVAANAAALKRATGRR